MTEPQLDLNKFKVDQMVELKSFDIGFRGAWFRCKITDIKLKENKITLKYPDYDDEIETLNIYEVPPYARRSNLSNRQLMIRPCYPLMYHKNTMPSVISEVCVVTDGTWNVEDLVDVYKKGCYWSGRVTKVLSEDKVQIDYPLPPAGEGKDKIYKAFCKDLRPSLFWSQKEGWTLPTMDGRAAGDSQLIFPSRQDPENDKVDDAEVVGVSPLDAYVHGTSNSLVEGETHIQSSETKDAAVDDVEEVGGSPLDSLVEGKTKIQSSDAKDAAKDATVYEGVNMDDLESVDSISTMGVQENNTATSAAFEEGTDCSIDLNIMHEDTLEAPILDLEELANRVRWLKCILHSHQPASNDATTSWKFA